MILRDTTERRTAEEEQTRLLAMLDSGFDAIVVRDAEGRITSWNRGAMELYGWTREEALGQVTHSLFRTRFPKPIGEIMADIERDGRWEGELVHTRKDGKVLVVFSRWTVERDSARRSVSILETNMDITERKRAEAALRESEERYRAAASIVTDIVWRTDAAGDFVQPQDSWEKYTGQTWEQHRGGGWVNAVHPDDRERVAQLWRRACETRSPYESRGRLWHGPTQSWRYYVGRAVPLLKPDGSVREWIGCDADVHEQKLAEEGLERLVAERTAKLQELVGELEHLSYTITHDMRAPLRAMRAFAEILKEDGQDRLCQEQRSFIARIITGAERMDALITDALNYSKAVRSELPVGPVDVERLLRGMLDTYPEFQEPGSEISIAGKLPLVMGNEAGLTQCFSNLIGNAVKFAQPGVLPEVRIWSEARDGWVRLWVADNGIGISNELLPRVFHMFSRGSSPQAGTGIGLALARKVVERIGGRIGVESELGCGSRFWVELSAGYAIQAATQSAHPASVAG